MGEGVAPIPTSCGCWGHPLTNQDPKAKGGIEPDLSDNTHKAASLPSEDPYSTSALTIDAGLGTCATTDPTMWLLWSKGCLHAPELVEVKLQAPVGIMPIGLLATPGISSMTSSHIVKDELMGVTYMDIVTTSIGRVTISGPGLEALPTGPMIEDITDSQ